MANEFIAITKEDQKDQKDPEGEAVSLTVASSRGQANVAQADVEAEDGVLHVIDAVL